MIGEALAIGTALVWAASTILSAEALKQIDPIRANALKVLFSAILMLFVAFASGELQNLSSLNLNGFLLVTLAAIIGFGIGDTYLLKGITLIGVSRSYTIAYAFPLFTMILGTLFLGEPFLLEYLAGTIMIVLGVITISTERTDKKNLKRDDYLKGILSSFLAAILWSVGITLLALGLKEISVISANVTRFPFLFLFLLLVSCFKHGRWNLNRKNLALLAVSGFLGLVLGGITYMFSVKLIGVSRATPLSSSSPVWASVMSSLFLKEKVTWKIILSSVIVVIGSYFLI